MQSFWRNWPKRFFGNLTIATFVYLLCSTKKFKLKERSVECMRYRVFKFWEKLEKNCRVFLTNRMEGSLHPLAKNFLFPLSTRKNFPVSILSSAKKIYTPCHYITVSML